MIGYWSIAITKKFTFIFHFNFYNKATTLKKGSLRNLTRPSLLVHSFDRLLFVMTESSYAIVTRKVAPMTMEERQKKRLARQLELKKDAGNVSSDGVSPGDSDTRIADLLSRNEDELLNFVASVNKIYHEKLCKPAPFMTFVLCGMQSAGKSTIMERFLRSVLNIVQEGTGTRCPLDTTCIHDDSCLEPKCILSGDELKGGGEN